MDGSAGRDGVAQPPGRTHRVHLPALDREIECRDDESLFAAARREGVRIVGACGGRGTCGSCVVRVHEGRTDQEEGAGSRKWLRACRVKPRSDLTVEVAPRSLARVVRTDITTGEDDALPLDPAVVQHRVRVEVPSLATPASDTDRLRRALLSQHGIDAAGIDAAAVRDLPGLLRRHDGQVEVRLSRGEGGPRIVGCAPPASRALGLAVDLGTTNVAGFLVDLAAGRRLASLGLENPQVAWGADLISRLDHAIADAGTATELQRGAARAIDALAHDLAQAVGASRGDIVDVVVCGNTAMQHLLAGWPVAQLARAPFVAAVSEALDVSAHELGLHVAPGARLHVAPTVGGFVGGDHVTAMLATEHLWTQPGVTLVMDIGTNTEISLVHEGRITSASCPSGPALEGGHIGCGMRAAEGAIEALAIEGDKVRLQVIGGGAPLGLCGSGVLDALAAFVRAGWIDRRGRIVSHGEQVDGQRAITLAAQTADSAPVRFTQNDVRAVQLAKAAIRTGVQLLADAAGVDETRIDRFVIAGAFGAHIDVASAIEVGMFPRLPLQRFSQVGNAAGLGVQQMLASRERRARAARLARECRSLELAVRPDFQPTFLHHIGFGR